MNKLAENPKVIFLGQQVAVQDFYGTLKDIPLNRRVEMPVAEELQLGLSIGLSLQGFIPVSIFQRCDFLPRAFDQLVNHLNLIETLSQGIFKPRVIIRTTIGSKTPLDTGLQHSKDLTEVLDKAVDFPVLKVTTPKQVKDAYWYLFEADESVIVIEVQDLYK